MRGGGLARWIAIGAVSVLAVLVGVVAMTAYERVHTATPTGQMAPAPTFTLGVRTPTPTPTGEAALPTDQQRFLAIGETQWWRATAGACGGRAPVIERSSDAGATWIAVTPNYLGIERVLTLNAFTGADAEVVAGVAGCNAQALRTYTRGQFWESYPDVLTASRFVDPKDAASIHLATATVPAPCGASSGLHAQGDVIALVCDGRAWSWTGTVWEQLAPESAIAVAIDGGEVVVAHAEHECAGVALSRVAPAGAAKPVAIGCAAAVDADAALAIDVTGADVVVWSGDELVFVQ